MADEKKLTKAELAEEKAKNKASKKANKAKKVKKHSIANFFKDLKSEMKKITWYPKKATLRDTLLVIVALVLLAVAIGLIDAGFMKCIKLLGNLG